MLALLAGLLICFIGKVVDVTYFNKRKPDTMIFIFVWMCFMVGMTLVFLGGIEVIANENTDKMELWTSEEYLPMSKQFGIMHNAKKELQTLMGDDKLKREFVRENMRLVCR